jgi:hypothetical protein
MKILTAVVAIVLFASCKKESTATLALNEMADTSAVVKSKGSFMNGPWGAVSGNAKILFKNNAYQLQLDSSFVSSNGPDLKVYISQEIQPVNFVNLGSLKTTNGSQLYNIPAAVDISLYKYALIHCQQYNHLFGSAELKP